MTGSCGALRAPCTNDPGPPCVDLERGTIRGSGWGATPSSSLSNEREDRTITPVEPNGTLHLDAFELPPSAGWSEEALKVFLKRFSGLPVSAQSIRGSADEEAWLASCMAFRAGMTTL